MKYLIFGLLLVINIQVGKSQDCRGFPQFVTKLGFDPSRSALSSSERFVKGIVLIELSNTANEGSQRSNTYQDSTWKMAGYMGAIATDKLGDTYCLTKANVNMLYNKPKDQNNIYRIDSKTGKMSFYMALKGNGWPNPQNAYGGMGSFYDCDTHNLIVASIMGSTQKVEMGRIFVVDLEKKTQKVVLDSIDVMGLAISSVEGKRKLYFAKAREPMIYSVEIDASNNIIGKVVPCINLDGLGPRGNDKGRRIRFDADGKMKVYGVDFLYNLSAPSEKMQSIYKFQFNSKANRWVLVAMS